MFLPQIILALAVFYKSPKACCSLSLSGQQKVKKETTFVISRVISAVQGSAPPMENFRVLQTKKAEGSFDGSNTFTSITREYEVKPERPSKCKLLNL